MRGATPSGLTGRFCSVPRVGAGANPGLRVGIPLGFLNWAAELLGAILGREEQFHSRIRLLLTLIPLIGFVVLLSACSKKHEVDSASKLRPSLKVQVQPAETRTVTTYEELPGTVRARISARIESKIQGRIHKLEVVPGKQVQNGEILVELDALEFQARLDQALATRRQTERDLERAESLLGKQAATQAEFDAAQTRHRVAVGGATEAGTLLAHARIAAPFGGIITRKHLNAGDLATPGRTLLEMDDPATLRLEAEVPEALLKQLQIGTTVSLRSSEAGGLIECRVSEIAPAADIETHTYTVKFDLPPDTSLRSGQFARVSIPLAESRILRIPGSALVQRGQMEIVFVATQGMARLRLIKVGRRFGTDVEVLSGLENGEQVVINPTAQLTDGQPVEIR